MTYYALDDPDDDLDEDDDEDLDEDGDDEEDEDGDDEEDEDDDDAETWQVLGVTAVPLKFGLFLTSGCELPRLARISSSTEVESARPGFASRRRSCR